MCQLVSVRHTVSREGVVATAVATVATAVEAMGAEREASGANNSIDVRGLTW